MEEDKIKDYLKNLNCRGCNNHCPLHDPICGRSKIFIQEAIEKLNQKKTGKEI